MEVLKVQEIFNLPDEKVKPEVIDIDIKDSQIIIKDDMLNKNVLFLFVNPRSGSQEGKCIFDISQKYGKSFLKNSNIIELRDNIVVYLFNICVIDSINIGIDMIKTNLTYFKKNSIDFKSIKVLIGGGDGTVISIIECFHKHEIDIKKCIFGHIPFGTGNDLSNALGFGSKNY
jgi:diacylglycerol kinase (ATP)